MDDAVEVLYRAFGCELIQEACILLRRPQVVAATGQTLLQRFFYRQSLTDHAVEHVAMGALFLAAKIEEKKVSLKSLVTLFSHIIQVGCCSSPLQLAPP